MDGVFILVTGRNEVGRRAPDWSARNEFRRRKTRRIASRFKQAPSFICRQQGWHSGCIRIENRTTSAITRATNAATAVFRAIEKIPFGLAESVNPNGLSARVVASQSDVGQTQFQLSRESPALSDFIASLSYPVDRPRPAQHPSCHSCRGQSRCKHRVSALRELPTQSHLSVGWWWR